MFTLECPRLGITDISRHTGISKSSVHRLVKTLVADGLLEAIPGSRKYRPGLGVLSLSGVITSNLEIHREALPYLEQLVDKLEETVHLGIIESNHVVYLHKVECKQPVALLTHIGKSNPIHCTSSGKAILAFQPKEIIEDFIQHTKLEKYGPASPTDPEIFRAQLEEVREKGYALTVDEFYKGVISIAAPIRDYTGEVIASVSVVGPTQRIREQEVPMIVQHVRQAGQNISECLGYFGD